MNKYEINFDYLTDEEIHLLIEDLQGMTIEQELVRCTKLLRGMATIEKRYPVLKCWIERLRLIK